MTLRTLMEATQLGSNTSKSRNATVNNIKWLRIGKYQKAKIGFQDDASPVEHQNKSKNNNGMFVGYVEYRLTQAFAQANNLSQDTIAYNVYIDGNELIIDNGDHGIVVINKIGTTGILTPQKESAHFPTNACKNLVFKYDKNVIKKLMKLEVTKLLFNPKTTILRFLGIIEEEDDIKLTLNLGVQKTVSIKDWSKEPFTTIREYIKLIKGMHMGGSSNNTDKTNLVKRFNKEFETLKLKSFLSKDKLGKTGNTQNNAVRQITEITFNGRTIYALGNGNAQMNKDNTNLLNTRLSKLDVETIETAIKGE